MRKSKYLGTKFGNWECTHVGVARVQPKFMQGTRVPSKRPGHQLYYYVFERLTSDLKAMKMIRLTAAQASKVWKGLATVEEIADKKQSMKLRTFKDKVSYSFHDRF